jgi:hypothetical protein
VNAHPSIDSLWRDLLDAAADLQADILRRKAAEMADALDRDAQNAVEGASEWRNLNLNGRFE